MSEFEPTVWETTRVYANTPAPPPPRSPASAVHHYSLLGGPSPPPPPSPPPTAPSPPPRPLTHLKGHSKQHFECKFEEGVEYYVDADKGCAAAAQFGAILRNLFARNSQRPALSPRAGTS